MIYLTHKQSSLLKINQNTKLTANKSFQININALDNKLNYYAPKKNR